MDKGRVEVSCKPSSLGQPIMNCEARMSPSELTLRLERDGLVFRLVHRSLVRLDPPQERDVIWGKAALQLLQFLEGMTADG